ncbi:FadR/GntR family transcriptional regulator [Aureimonas frigidaquae]|uniref:FadR/GntR family transcriptional regulator n=1 Tax=Aureimonas frigidaquae TaxID=424757 RepID=UPI0009FAAC15|nr:FadR/GntR family transcriptional regulator [Aureimonas frigidaquae]
MQQETSDQLRDATGRGKLPALVDRLGRDVAGGVYRQGEPLPAEPELGLLHQASRSVVREAVKTLAAKGLLRVGPRTGTVVNPMERWSLLDPAVLGWMVCGGAHRPLFGAIDEVRYLIEPQAAALAAERAGPQDLQRLRTAFAAMQSAATEGDRQAAIRADKAFHLAILEATGNPVLRAFDAAVGAMLDILFREAVDHIGGFRDNLFRHAEVLEAIATRKPSEASFAMQRLIGFTRENMQRAGLYEPQDHKGETQ